MWMDKFFIEHEEEINKEQWERNTKQWERWEKEKMLEKRESEAKMRG